MVRKKPVSTTMDPCMEALERRVQESEERNRQMLQDALARMEAMVASLQPKKSGPDDPGDPTAKEKQFHGDGERRLRKVDLPVFNGDDAAGWLTKVERFFKVRKIGEDEKIDAVLVAMEGEALAWMQWWEVNTVEPSWNDLKEAVLCRFQPTVVNNPFEMLMNLKQAGSVREYRKKFETIASHIMVQDSSLFTGIFSNGLREDIRAEVRLQRPKNLQEMMDVSLLAEEKIGAVGRYGGRNFGGFKSNNTKPVTETNASSKNTDAGKNSWPLNAKTVGGKDIEERRKKGLCFTCEEKYTPGHVCKNKVLKLLYVEEITEVEKGDDEDEEIVWEGSMKRL